LVLEVGPYSKVVRSRHSLKNVLLVTFQFPPNPSVAALRPQGLYKYLPEFGWEVTILTAKHPARALDGQVLETDYKDTFGLFKRLAGIDAQHNLMAQIAQLKRKLHIRSERSPLDRLIAIAAEIAAYPDPQKGWRSPAFRVGDEHLQRQKVDAIISSSWPVSSHVVAGRLKERHRLAWVADFRDLWTQNHYYPYSRVRRLVERRLEVKTLSAADALVTVSEPLAARMRDLHADKQIHVVTNGFDPGDINMPERPVTEVFTITYTGNLYPGKQSPETLFVALGDLISEGLVDRSKVEVRFYGAEAGWVDGMAERYNLTGVIRQYGIVPRETALEKQRESQLLLLLKWGDPSARGTYTAKLFEYLAARRPILALGGYPDVVSDLLIETGAGRDAPTTEDAKVALRELYEEYQEAGEIACHADPGKIEGYSQREMARKFAMILNSICN
jgi:hypothetical protein